MKPENLILVVCGGLVLLALIIIPWGGMKKPASVKGDSNTDQAPLFINMGGTNSSNFRNTNIPCTYLIFIDVNNNTDAQNCSTGNIDYQNNNRYTTIEKAINSPAISKQNGGLIFVKAGNYSLTHEIDVNKTSVEIIGEGYGSIHTGVHYFGVTRFSQADGANLANIFLLQCGTCAVPGNIKLENFIIDGNNSTNSALTRGILVQSDFDDTIRDIQILSMKNIGIELQDCHACTLDNIYSESGAQAFYFFGVVNPSVMSGGRFTNLYADNFDSSTSFTLDGNVQGNVFANDIAQDDKGRCFYMFTDSGKTPKINTFSGNECYQLSGHSGLYAFDLAGSQSNTFTGNIILNWGQGASNTYDGFFLHVTGGVNSINNTFTGNNIISSGVTNHLRYGFNEADINQNFNVYLGNNIAGMATAPIRTQGNFSEAVRNIGYNPVASSTVTAGASPWTYTNKDGYTEQMILSTLGGQTAETCHGITTLLPTTLGTECTLDIGQSLTATWATTAPVYTKVPLD